MQRFTTTLPGWTAATLTTLGVAAALLSQIGANAAPRVHVSFPTSPVSAVQAVTALNPVVPPANRIVAAVKPAPKLVADESLRPRIKYETVRWKGQPVQTLDEESRLLLAKAAAEKAGLKKVGLSYHDVYGIIEAETSWIQRTGASKDGTPNLGLAQFEPRTAESMGLTDPGDPVQAVFAAALYMKTGAQWAADKLDGLKLTPAERAAKLREGVSIHYNLSVKGRNKWDGTNTDELPVETQRHIRNAKAGAAEAAQLARLIKI